MQVKIHTEVLAMRGVPVMNTTASSIRNDTDRHWVLRQCKCHITDNRKPPN